MEYRTMNVPLNELAHFLNELGSDPWRVVSVTPSPWNPFWVIVLLCRPNSPGPRETK
jgi:hypothetical protein